MLPFFHHESRISSLPEALINIRSRRASSPFSNGKIDCEINFP